MFIEQTTFSLTELTLPISYTGASLVAQQAKNLPARKEILEMQFQSLDKEDPLEEEMATHSSILA